MTAMSAARERRHDMYTGSTMQDRNDGDAWLDGLEMWPIASVIMASDDAPELARWQQCCKLAHTDQAPELLNTLWSEALLSTEAMAQVVTDVWNSCREPERTLDRADWRSMFQAAGYRHDGRRAARPRRPLQLYKVAFEQDRLNWSWTTELEDARRQAMAAGGLLGRGTRLWTVSAPPSTFLSATSTADGLRVVVDLEADPNVDLKKAVTELSNYIFSDSAPIRQTCRTRLTVVNP